jgi:hypothetical protein
MSRSEAGKLGHAKAAKRLAAFLAEKSASARKAAEGRACKHCLRLLPYEKRRSTYCSHSCAASHNQKGVSRRASVACPQCSESFRPKSRNHTYCSPRCSLDARSARLTERWLEGLELGGSWWGVSDYVRRWLISQYGEKCVLCEWAEVNPKSGKIPVQVNHVDGNPDNHRPENVQLLCPNCHSLTTSFGGLNRGNGRKQRYLGGAKSSRG